MVESDEEKLTKKKPRKIKEKAIILKDRKKKANKNSG